jgi:hypothetical protein
VGGYSRSVFVGLSLFAAVASTGYAAPPVQPAPVYRPAPVYQPPPPAYRPPPPVQQAPPQQQQQNDPNACYDAQHRQVACQQNPPPRRAAPVQQQRTPQQQLRTGQGQQQLPPGQQRPSVAGPQVNPNRRVGSVARPGVIRGPSGALRIGIPPHIVHNPRHLAGRAGARYNRQAFMFRRGRHLFRRHYYRGPGGAEFFYDDEAPADDPVAQAPAALADLPQCPPDSDDCQGFEQAQAPPAPVSQSTCGEGYMVCWQLCDVHSLAPDICKYGPSDSCMTRFGNLNGCVSITGDN